jgi:hypothetical protein
MSPWGLTRALAIVALGGATAVLSASQQQPDAPKPKPPDTGLIAGRVIDATTERPIAGALVVTYAERGETAARTNAAGQFVLEGLPEGSHPLFVTRFGYLTGRSGQSHPAGAGSGVTLAAGARVTDVVIRLWRRAAITGRVVDERGDPIVGLPVSASRIGFEARGDRLDEPTEGPRATTDDRGIFRFGGLVPGQYLVFVPSTQTAVPRSVIERAASASDSAERRLARQALEASGSTSELPGTRRGGISDGDLVRTIGPVHGSSRAPSAIYPTTFYPSATTSAGAAIVSVGAGDERSGIDLVMKAAIGVRISGRLSGPDGPVAMQPLRLVHEAAGEFAPAIDPPVATTVTDANGAFTFVGVPAGQYRLVSLSMPDEDDQGSHAFGVGVVSGGGAPAEIMVVEAIAPPRAVDSKARPVHWALLPVTAGERDLDGLEPTYRRGFRFRGRVVFEGAGTLPDAKEPWLALSIERADGRAIGLNRWASQSPDNLAVNARGEFETGTVPPGRYLIRVPKPPVEWQLQSAMVAGRDVSDDPLDIGADVEDVVLTFTAATRVSGHVADATGVSHAGIVIFPTESARWTNIGRSPHRIRQIPVERDGRFSVSGLPTGEYYIVAVRDPDRLDERSARQLQELAAIADRIVVTQTSMRAVTLRIREVR